MISWAPEHLQEKNHEYRTRSKHWATWGMFSTCKHAHTHTIWNTLHILWNCCKNILGMQWKMLAPCLKCCKCSKNVISSPSLLRHLSLFHIHWQKYRRNVRLKTLQCPVEYIKYSHKWLIFMSFSNKLSDNGVKMKNEFENLSRSSLFSDSLKETKGTFKKLCWRIPLSQNASEYFI